MCFEGGSTHTWACVCTPASAATLQGVIYSTVEPGTKTGAAMAHHAARLAGLPWGLC